jgi:hypothetical protein
MADDDTIIMTDDEKDKVLNIEDESVIYKDEEDSKADQNSD